jgi:sugar lactone lactonase YvrE
MPLVQMSMLVLSMYNRGEGEKPTFACSKAGSMICFQMAFRAVWSSFESRVTGRRLSLPNILSVSPRGRGVIGTMSLAGLETASSAGRGTERAVGENR